MPIHVVIVNYRSAQLVAECVRSLREEALGAIVVVNNSPTVEENQLLSAIAVDDSRVRIVDAGENLGFGGGINLGVRSLRLSPSDRLWFVNPDVLVTEVESAARLSVVLDQGFEMVSPAITTGGADEKSIWYGGGTFDNRRGVTVHWNDGEQLSALDTRKAPEIVTFITGAALMIRVDAWLRLGGFREDLFLYWEDSDLCIRAEKKGMKLAVLPTVTVWHQVGATSSNAGKSALYFYYMHRNRLAVAGESSSPISLLLGAGGVWTARFLLKAVKSQKPWEKIAASARGIRDGLRAQSW